MLFHIFIRLKRNIFFGDHAEKISAAAKQLFFKGFDPAFSVEEGTGLICIDCGQDQLRFRVGWDHAGKHERITELFNGNCNLSRIRLDLALHEMHILRQFRRYTEGAEHRCCGYDTAKCLKECRIDTGM